MRTNTIDLLVGLSVDEFLDQCLDEGCELLGGQTRPKPLPDLNHSRLQGSLVCLLDRFFGKRVLPSLDVRIGEDVLVPDVVVVESDSPRLYRDRLDEPPLLCVEVLSPSQTPAEMLAKCERYHVFGVPFCWVVDPVGRRAWEYHRLGAARREVTEALTGPCVLPLADLF